MWLLALLFAGMLLATLRLTTRYEYGPRSVRRLRLVLAGSLVLAFAVARFFVFRNPEPFPLALATVGLTVPLFLFSALVVVELLRKEKQRVYDERLEKLKRREQALLAEVEETVLLTRRELRRQEELEASGRDGLRRLDDCRSQVEAWKREGGAARIRSLKVEEWEAEFRALDPRALDERRLALEAELQTAADPERRSQLKAMIAVARLVAGDDETEETVGESKRIERSVADLARRRRAAEEALARVRNELREWRGRLADFLAKEIHLD
ncbi:MAG: hypothetical protein AB1645_09005 [Bacillota bacterium]|jgi:hypothetical protein